MPVLRSSDKAVYSPNITSRRGGSMWLLPDYEEETCAGYVGINPTALKHNQIAEEKTRREHKVVQVLDTLSDTEYEAYGRAFVGKNPNTIPAYIPAYVGKPPPSISWRKESLQLDLEENIGPAYVGIHPMKLRRTRGHPKRAVRMKSGPTPEKTVVTPHIYNIAKDIFPPRLLEVVETDQSQEPSVEAELPPERPHHENAIKSIVWVAEKRLAPNHYGAVILDGVRYDVGDTVMVEMGKDANERRHKNASSPRSQSTNPLANTKWFAKICYMFESNDGHRSKMFHAQWYIHGAQIILQETAHPQCLFLVDECDDMPLDSIYQRANVRILAPTESEPAVTLNHNDFFTALMYCERDNVFFERTMLESRNARAYCRPWKPCVACGKKKLDAASDRWTYTDGGILLHGDISYHQHDFCYIRPGGYGPSPYIIGQILGVRTRQYHGSKTNITVDVRVFEREAAVIQAERVDTFGPVKTDARCLYFTNEVMRSVPVQRVEGKAYVIHAAEYGLDLDDWVLHDDHFVVKRRSDKPRPIRADLRPLRHSDFEYCSVCYEGRLDAIQDSRSVVQLHAKLSGLELFAGAGGLSAGLDQSGFVDTKWVVEWATSATHTYIANHPDVVVYNQSVNVCLKHALQTLEGKNPAPLLSRDKRANSPLPSMPQPGEVDIIFGGPPCQGFSNMNHNKKPDDYRNTLIAGMLSYVDFYHPKYFLLENVLGILDWKAMNNGIEMGISKFIMRTLTSLGYQIHFRLLNAGQYGAPQSRNRVIFIGARRDCSLPLFPIPTHSTPKGVTKRKLPTGETMYPVVRYRPFDADLDSRDTHLQFAPYMHVTVEDAISDLPNFDWKNPHKVIPPTKQSHSEEARRAAAGFPSFDATKASNAHFCGYVHPVNYSYKPQNQYQSWMRSAKQSKLHYHYTGTHGPQLIERTVNIPMRANACHDELPKPLCMQRMLLPNQRSKSTHTSVFKRIDGKGLFCTALTTAYPGAKGGSILHPNQKRILTIRECARAQGFPDHWVFLSEHSSPSEQIKDQIRQIGNAVPIPLGLALGKELGKVLNKMWQDEDISRTAQRENSPEY